VTIDDIQARFMYYAAHPDQGQVFCRGADRMLTSCEAEQISRKVGKSIIIKAAKT